MDVRLLALLLTVAGTAHAVVYTCSPPPETPLCQFPEKIDVTFIGTPIATNYDPDPPGGGDLAFLNMWYRFSVIEPFTGLRPEEKELVIHLSLGGGSPQIGQKFFVHAKRAGNQFRLAECGATRPVEEASADIQYLRERQAGTFRPFIAGSVLRHYSGSPYAVESGLDGPPRGLAGANVEIQGETRRRLQTDDQGKFRVDDVKPGRYTIREDFPGYKSKGTQLVDVPANGCGIAHVGMFTNSSISGVVKRADGTPAIGVELDLVDKDPRYRSMTETLEMIKTGSHGEFFMDNLPSGEFLLGINIRESTRYPDQTPPTYFPGVPDRNSASVIALAPNEAKSGLTLQMLPPRAFRVVRVHIKWPDGAVPSRGALNARANQGIYVSRYDLKDGVFDLQLLQGVDYWLDAAALDETRRATQFARGTWVYTDNFRITAGTDPLDITLTAHFAEPQWAKAVYGEQR
jgi:hypothetical protein